VTWVPHARQKEALECSAREVFYGGAAGGGKTDWGIMAIGRWAVHPQFNGLILRRSFPQLEKIIQRANELYRVMFPGVTYNQSSHLFKMPNGARVKIGYFETFKDRWLYHGQEYQAVYWDELTEHHTEDPYRWMFTRLRAPGGFMPTFQYASGNPVGPGVQWVSDRWKCIDHPSGRVALQDPGGWMRMFIPARLEDNPTIDGEGNREYRDSLMALPERQRLALLEGRWDVPEGAVFDILPEHIVDSVAAPAVPKLVGVDWGFASNGCALWGWKDGDGRITIYRELYFKRQSPEHIAQTALKLEEGDGDQIARRLDPACWGTQTGASIAESLWRSGWHCQQANNDRINGFAEVHARLTKAIKTPEGARPALQIAKSCRHLLRTLPLLQADKGGVDIDTKMEDHAYDALRYLLMASPLSGVDPGRARGRNYELQRRRSGANETTGY
jgi:hypothetical protein